MADVFRKILLSFSASLLATAFTIKVISSAGITSSYYLMMSLIGVVIFLLIIIPFNKLKEDHKLIFLSSFIAGLIGSHVVGVVGTVDVLVEEFRQKGSIETLSPFIYPMVRNALIDRTSFLALTLIFSLTMISILIMFSVLFRDIIGRWLGLEKPPIVIFSLLKKSSNIGFSKTFLFIVIGVATGFIENLIIKDGYTDTNYILLLILLLAYVPVNIILSYIFYYALNKALYTYLGIKLNILGAILGIILYLGVVMLLGRKVGKRMVIGKKALESLLLLSIALLIESIAFFIIFEFNSVYMLLFLNVILAFLILPYILFESKTFTILRILGGNIYLIAVSPIVAYILAIFKLSNLVVISILNISLLLVPLFPTIIGLHAYKGRSIGEILGILSISLTFSASVASIYSFENRTYLRFLGTPDEIFGIKHGLGLEFNTTECIVTLFFLIISTLLTIFIFPVVKGPILGYMPNFTNPLGILMIFLIDIPEYIVLIIFLTMLTKLFLTKYINMRSITTILNLVLAGYGLAFLLLSWIKI